MRSHHIRLASLIGVIVVCIGGGVYAANQNLRLSGRRAEAQLMLSYLATLENAHFADKNTFVAFSDYGAPDRGRDRCERPAGAVQLGFMLENCQQDVRRTIRYAYHVEVGAPVGGLANFAGEATSGSDAAGQSLVCLGSDAVDAWQVDNKKIPEQKHGCR